MGNERFKSVDAMLGIPEIKEQIVLLNIDKLIPYTNHPFKPYTSQKLEMLKASIKNNGLINPIVVISNERNTYIILLGHNRVNAMKELGENTISAIIKEDLDETATQLYVVESNLYQRSIEEMFPSELAKAFQMQLNALKQQGKRNDLTSSHCETKLKTANQIGDNSKLSGQSVYRYIDLIIYCWNF